jgi:hypothetical protein
MQGCKNESAASSFVTEAEVYLAVANSKRWMLKTFYHRGRLNLHALAFASTLGGATAPVAVYFGVLSLIYFTTLVVFKCHGFSPD